MKANGKQNEEGKPTGCKENQEQTEETNDKR